MSCNWPRSSGSRADIDWRNSFIGVVAYEAAYRHYTALYPKLLETLFSDPDFRAAVGRRPLAG